MTEQEKWRVEKESRLALLRYLSVIAEAEGDALWKALFSEIMMGELRKRMPLTGWSKPISEQV